MDLSPSAIDALPDAGFAAADRDWRTVVEPLVEAGVAQHHCVISQPAQMWTCHRHIHRTWSRIVSGRKLKVVAMKRQAFSQNAVAFSFKAAQIVAAERGIAVPVAAYDAFQHRLVQIEDRLITVRECHG